MLTTHLCRFSETVYILLSVNLIFCILNNALQIGLNIDLHNRWRIKCSKLFAITKSKLNLYFNTCCFYFYENVVEKYPFEKQVSVVDGWRVDTKM